MTEREDYEKMLNDTHASIGFAMAAGAVYAARHGWFPGPNDWETISEWWEWRAIGRDLKSRYGNSLTVDEVRAEMASANQKGEVC